MLRGLVSLSRGARLSRSAPMLAGQAPPIAALACRRALSSSVEPATSPPPPPESFSASSASSSLAYFSDLTWDIGPLALNRMRDNVGARHKAKRWGRGHGAGRGRTCGRGHKGTKQRAGNHNLIKQEGGNAKLVKVLPKMGPRWSPKREYVDMHLHRLQEAVRTGRLPLPEGRPLDVKDLFDAKLVTLRTRHLGVKLVGTGLESFSTPISIEVQLADESAIDAIEAGGGSIESVYYSRVSLRYKLKPHRFEAAPVGRRHGNMRPRPALPPPTLMRDVYLSEKHRGYLRNLEVGDVVRPQEHPAHVDLSVRMKPRYPGWAAADQQAMAEGKPFIKADGHVATPEERLEAQKRRPYASQIMQESPTDPNRGRPYVPPIAKQAKVGKGGKRDE